MSSSVVPFSSCLQSLPASGSFQMYQLFAWGGQSIGSFSFNISPSNELPGLISFRMDWLYLLAGSRTVLIIKLLKTEMKKNGGGQITKETTQGDFLHMKDWGVHHTPSMLSGNKATGHIRETFQNTGGKKKALQLGRKQRPTQDPLLVPQVKVKSEKDLHNSFLLIYLFFNWSITALQNFVVFCQTSTWINHRYTYVLLKMTSENFVSSNPHCAVVTGGHFQTCTVLGTF